MRSLRTLKVGTTIGAVVLAALHLWIPEAKIDAITLALFAIAILPWLQPIFKSVELPGGFKVEMQEIREAVRNASGAAQSAERKAELAVASFSDGGRMKARMAPAESRERLDLLAKEYVTIRKAQRSGTARTQAMTEVVREMLDLVPSLNNVDVKALLLSNDAGQRLAGYAYLYAQPDPAYIEALVDSVTSVEDKPFGQYWGLLAIGRAVANIQGGELPMEVVDELRSLAGRVPAGTDRSYELRKILTDLGCTT
jgi:hypothetical protein